MAPEAATRWVRRRGQTQTTCSGRSQVLLSGSCHLTFFIVRMIADDVGHVVVAFVFVGDKGRIVIVIINRIVGFDVVFGFQNRGLLAGVLFGIGLLEGHQFL